MPVIKHHETMTPAEFEELTGLPHDVLVISPRRWFRRMCGRRRFRGDGRWFVSIARRRGWPRRTPNAYGGLAGILVPDDASVRPRLGVDGDQPPYELGTTGQPSIC
jgi:hypothetical protein